MHHRHLEADENGIVRNLPKDAYLTHLERVAEHGRPTAEQVKTIELLVPYLHKASAPDRRRWPEKEVGIGILAGGTSDGDASDEKDMARMLIAEMPMHLDTPIDTIMENAQLSRPGGYEILVDAPVFEDLSKPDSIWGRLERFLSEDGLIVRAQPDGLSVIYPRHEEAVDDLLLVEWIRNRREQFPQEDDPNIGVLVPAMATEAGVQHSRERLAQIAKFGISIDVVQEDHLPSDNKWYDYLIEAGTYNGQGDDNSKLSALRFLKHDGLVVDLMDGSVRSKTEAIHGLRRHISEYPAPAPVRKVAEVLPFPVRRRTQGGHKKSA